MTDDPDRSGKKDPAPRYADPISALKSEMDNLFDSFIGGLPAFSGMFGTSRSFALTPHMDVKETDKEILVEAELPVIDDKDMSLSLQDGVLAIRGEKKLERDEKEENYRMMERRHGGFQRSVRLPDSVDEDNVEASFDKGVLKIRLPKRPEPALLPLDLHGSVLRHLEPNHARPVTKGILTVQKRHADETSACRDQNPASNQDAKRFLLNIGFCSGVIGHATGSRLRLSIVH